MPSSRRCSLHLEHATSVEDIISVSHRGLCTDDDYIPTIAKKKFQPQPAIVKPSQKTDTESKGSKPAERSNATRPSQDPSEPNRNPSNLLKQAAPATAKSLSHVSEANSLLKDAEQHSRRPRPPVIEGIFFIESPERELSATKKIDESGELGLFGEFIKKCTLCKKEFKLDKDVYMYNDHLFCSWDCRDNRITLDGFSGKDFGLDKEDRKTMKSYVMNFL